MQGAGEYSRRQGDTQGCCSIRAEMAISIGLGHWGTNHVAVTSGEVSPEFEGTTKYLVMNKISDISTQYIFNPNEGTRIHDEQNINILN